MRIIIISAVVAVHETFYNLAIRETVLKSKEYKRKDWAEIEIYGCGYTLLVIKSVQGVADCGELY